MNLIVASNRLPFAATKRDGEWKIEPGSGGLVTALKPALEDRGGRWIGWIGATSEELPDPHSILRESHQRFGYGLLPVPLTQAERDGFYYGFSNEVIWPLFHDLPSLANFDPAYWIAYEAVNRKFAGLTARLAGENDFIWAHDYHLMTMARELRERGVRSRMAFFLHIPFPPLDIFLKLPWRSAILRSLLEYDLIGFQTVRDRRNFLDCIRRLVPDATASGRGDVRRITLGSREIRVGAFPISIDAGDFERRGMDEDVARKKREILDRVPGRKIVLGVDRLDYTKGIPQKLEAFRNMLSRFEHLRERVTLLQVVVPSREDIPRYRDHKRIIERLVGQINGQFTRSGWVPIQYIYRTLEGPRLPAYYLAADVALVTPLKDGMNLVAKEYCASHADEQGALVLSEFAGAASQLQKGAFLVNPFDVEGVAGAIERALNLSPEEQRSRMRRLRRSVKEYDIFRWVDNFLDAAISRDLSDFPKLEEYMPVLEIP
jgi:alpha,alpha-trehalose-phosphate synthase [UDP-forming]